jgi:ABC-type multidrug transport system fused ATPase/permease subunit
VLSSRLFVRYALCARDFHDQDATPFLQFMPDIQGKILDDVINGFADKFDGHVRQYVVLAVSVGLFSGARSWAFNSLGRLIAMDLRVKLFESMVKQDIAFFDGKSAMPTHTCSRFHVSRRPLPNIYTHPHTYTLSYTHQCIITCRHDGGIADVASKQRRPGDG